MANITGDNLDNTIAGTAGDDSIEGLAGNDIITAASGNDTVLAGADNDSVEGQSGDDSILGEGGADILNGGLGNDFIDGGTESDTIHAHSGDDTLNGGAGNDTISGNATDDGNDVIDGGSGDDRIEDYEGDNTIQGGAGNDFFNYVSGSDIQGGSGDDYIRTYNYGGSYDVNVQGGDGNDTLINGGTNQAGNTHSYFGGAGNDSLYGTQYADVLDGGADNDLINGNNGDDTLTGGAGNDSLSGQQGDDSLVGGSGDDTLNGGTGNDELSGGAGTDIAAFSGVRANYMLIDNGGGTIRVVDRSGTYGDDTVAADIETLRFSDGDLAVAGLTLGSDIDGTNGPDSLDGTAGDDSVTGLQGNDTINGAAGGDILDGNSGDDVLDGGGDNDVLRGDLGNDTLTGGAGADSLLGGTGDDSLDGGMDNDTILGEEGNDTLIGGAGDDTIGSNATDSGDDVIYGGSGDDRIEDYDGNNTIEGGAGNDFFNYVSGSDIQGGSGDDYIRTYNYGGTYDVTVQGGDGNDTLINGGTNQSTNLHSYFGGTGNDSLYGTQYGDVLDGGADNDLINGNNGDDTLTGGAGNDSLSGQNDNDEIYGGSGDDSLFGGNGNDQIFGGDGADSLSGGLGDDTIDGGTPGGAGAIVQFTSTRANYTITTGSLGEATVSGPDGTDVITGVSILRFSDQDVVIGSNPGDTYVGTSGNDSYTGSEGDDSAVGGSGDDTLHGNGGIDTLEGQEGNDSLTGGFGDDSVDGGAGSDTVLGNDGQDTLLGGAGNDTISNHSTDDGNDVIYGGSGDDRIEDYEGDNTIQGGPGNDFFNYVSGSDIQGGSGDDYIRTYNYGGSYDVNVYGGDGNDTLVNGGTNFSSNMHSYFGGSGNDSLYGTQYGDHLEGGADNDLIHGNSGNDTALGGMGNDSLRGNVGDDSLVGGSGDDTLRGDEGDDELFGGDGTDIASYTGSREDYLLVDNGGGTIRVVHRAGTFGDDTISGIETLRFDDGDVAVSGLVLGQIIGGTNGPDSLDGTAGDDSIDGLQGNDTINGDDGGDILNGQSGEDVLNGGGGNDLLVGNSGNDDLSGDAGEDLLYGGLDNDSLDGGADNDTLHGDTGDDTLIGGAGNDTLGSGSTDTGDDEIYGGSGDDRIEDYEGNNTIQGGPGNDFLNYVSGSDIQGGSGDDYIRTYNYGGAYDVNVQGGDGNDTLVNGGTNFSSNMHSYFGGSGNDSLYGTQYGDHLEGGDDNDLIHGNSGNDTILGGAGDDSLRGNNEDDSLVGGAGDDTLVGGNGNDTLDGGADNSGSGTDGDIAVYTGSRGQYSVVGNASGLQVINLSGNGEGTDVLLNIERLRFSDGDLIVSTDIAGDSVTGGPGDDSLVGTIVNDTIEGYGGNDTIVGLSGLDQIDAGSGDDTIQAGAGNDSIIAGDGDDTIDGGSGDDTIEGGAGLNTAVYAGNFADYTITGDATAATVAGPNGTDILTDVRVLQFADQTVSFNNAPSAVSDTASTDEDVFVDILVADLLANDSDADGDPLDIVSVQNAVNGTAVLHASGSGDFVRFTPAANFNGAASFEVNVSDGFETSTSTVAVTVNSVNDAPMVTNDAATTDEDVPVNIDVVANDTDVEDGQPFVTAVGTNPNGVATIEGDGTVTFTPNADYNGTTVFQYTVSDSNGVTRNGSVTVTVTPVNDAPVGVDDSATTYVGTPVEVDVTANDTDVEGDALSVIGVGTASNGTVSIDDKGNGDPTDDTVVYTPNAAFTGTDSFTYTVSDGNGGTDTATVNITVSSLSDIITTFDSDLEGWTTINDATGLAWVASGGNPDGHATATDVGTGATWYWSAPTAYLGNKAPFYGGSLSFDLKQNLTTSPMDRDDIRIVGTNGTTIVLDLSHPGTDWTSYDVHLSTMSDWRIGTEDGAVASMSDIQGVLADIENLYIRGEFRNGSDNSQIDNVILSTSPAASNAAPVATDDFYSLSEDVIGSANAAGGVLNNDSDADGDTLTVSLLSDVSNGTLVLNSDGSFSYEPDQDYNGTDTFTYTIDDGNGGTDTATVLLTINPVNDDPVGTGESYSTDEDVPLTVNVAAGVLANDTDVDGDTLSVSVLSDVTDGTLALNADGSFTYTPDADFNGTDSFTYTIDDGNGGTDTATVSITINPVNDAPVATNDFYSLSEDVIGSANAAGGVLNNDSDADGDTLTVSLLSDVSNGTLVLNSDGSFSYEPDQDYNGTDSFSYTIDDGNGGTDTATVLLTINPVNDAPMAVNDSYSTSYETTLNVSGPGVLANDSDVDGDPLVIASFIQAANGTVSLFSDGSFDYVPDAGFSGLDTFQYDLDDGDGGIVTATVEITVGAPMSTYTIGNITVLEGDSGTTTATFTVTRGGHTNFESQSMNVAFVEGTATEGDTLGAAGVDYIPNQYLPFTFASGQTSATFSATVQGDTDVEGNETFFLQLLDLDDGNNVLASGQATIIDDDSPNTAPVADADSYSVHAGDVLTVPAGTGLLANDTDADGDTLSVVSFEPSANGIVNMSADGSFTFTPDAGYAGTETLSYTISDGTTTASGTYTLAVTNTAPVADADSYSVHSGEVLTIPAGSGLLSNDTDADGDPLSVVSFEPSANGIVNMSADGSFTFTPDAGYAGTETLTYTITDGVTTASGTYTLAVTNADPMANADSYSVHAGDVLTIPAGSGLLSNDTDADGDPLSVVSFEPSANGIVNMSADGSFTFTPDAGYTGTETLAYTITDGVTTASGTYTLAVTNADPMANADSYSVHAGDVLTIPAGSGLLANDTDADGDPLSVVSFEPSANGIVNMSADGSFTFTPDAGYTGTETLAYTITDGTTTTSGTYTLAVTNTDPVANDDTYSATAGEVLTVDAAAGLLSNDTDADGDPLSVFSVVPPSNGVLNASADGSFTYTPDGGFTGTDTFTYRIVDGAGSDTATVTINVGAVPPSNDAPGLEAGANVTVNEGDTVMRTLTLTDSDTETRSFSVDWGDGTVETFDSGLTNPQIQHLFLADGTFTVNVMVDDNAGASNSTETDSFQVTVLNLPPVAGDDSGAVSEDGPAVTLGSPLFNDTDPGLDPLTLIEFAGVLETDGGFFDTAHLLPSGALLTFTSGGEFIYDPNGAYEGLSTGDSTTDSFTYTISDDDGATDTATVTVTINGVNDDPVAGADSAVTPQNTPVDIDVLANDSDAETFSSLSIASVGAASNGTVAIDDNGTAGDASDDFVTYTPNGGFTGTDSFTYTLMDSDGGTDVGTVTVTVGANPDEYLVGTNGPDTIDGMNGNDTILGRNGNDLLIGGTGNDRLLGQGGSDTMIGGDGNDFIRTAGGDLLVFDMNDGDDKVKGFDTSMDLIQLSDGGTASFVYDAGQNRTTMTYGATIVTFFGANVTAASVLTAGAPVATDDTASTLETLPVAIDVLANDSDPDGDPLEITGYTNGANGTVVLDTKGTADTTDDVLVYTANGGFTGTDTFTYDISDGTNTASATVQVMVTAPIVGTGGPDMLIGTDGIDSISGRGGDDTLIGLGGDDTLRGDGGNDVIRGDAGNEFIHGGHGDDLLDGSDGADTLVGSAGADTLQGGDGDDNLFGGADDDRLLGEAGNDRLVGGAGMDHMTGGTGDDTIIAEGGDTLVFNLADGNDLVNDFTSGLDMVVLAEGGTYTLTTDAVLNRSIIDYGSTQITFMDEILTMADITVL